MGSEPDAEECAAVGGGVTVTQADRIREYLPALKAGEMTRREVAEAVGCRTRYVSVVQEREQYRRE